jgi:hypothetical protein
LLSCHQNAEINHDIKIANRSSENVAQFKYLGMTVTNQNFINKSMILPVVRYGYETGFLTLWEEHRLRLFKKRVLKGIFGISRAEVT